MIFPGGIARAVASTADGLSTARSRTHGTNELVPARACSTSTALNDLIGTAGNADALGKRYETDDAAGSKTVECGAKPRGPGHARCRSRCSTAVSSRSPTKWTRRFYRSAFNPIIAEAHDACHGLYHAETGATLVQGTSGLPIFVGRHGLRREGGHRQVAQDRRTRAGRHLSSSTIPMTAARISNDFRLVRPLIRNGKVFALARLGRPLARCRRQCARQLQRQGHRRASRKASACRR